MSNIIWDASASRGLSPEEQFTPRPVFRLDSPSRAIGYVLKTPPEKIFGEGSRSVPRAARVVAKVRVKARNCKWDSDPMKEHPNEHYAATFGIMLFQRMEGFGAPGNGRWFSRERVVLRPGTHVIGVQMLPENWSNVWGLTPPANAGGLRAWEQTLLRPIRPGLAFGGKFYGHGVSVTQGSATIEVISVSVVL